MNSKLIKIIILIFAILVIINKTQAQFDTTSFYTYPIYDGLNNKINIEWKLKIITGDSINIIRKNGLNINKIASNIPILATSYVDNTALPKQMYEYKLYLYSGGVILDSTKISKSILAINWPLTDNSFNIGAVLGDFMVGNTWKYHEGVDFVGYLNEVTAIRGGIIIDTLSNVDPNPNTYAVVEVDKGGGKKEYDIYYHLEDVNYLKNKKAVYSGEVIGKIDSGYYDSKYNHLHYSVTNFYDYSSGYAGVIYPEGSNLLNPLEVFDNILYDDIVTTPIDPMPVSGVFSPET